MIAEFLPIEVVKHRTMMHLFLGHLVEDFRRCRILLAKTLSEIAIDAAVFFFIGDRKGQNFLLGEVGKAFHGTSLRVSNNTFLY